ncbi:MAG TPA: hypothetical protein VJ552_07505 [Sediminibacterium sp.]|nr:hypothetical protein [Sediminibacterium sp.]
MKELILRNWTFMRALRLVLGIIIVVEAVMAKEVVFGLVGVFFSGMALLNTGCCGTGACYTPPVKRDAHLNTTKDISYEEVV